MVFLATLKIDAVLVCLNYYSTEEELDYMLRQSDSTILIVNDKDLIEKIDLEKFTYLKITLKIKTLFKLGSIVSEMKNVLNNELMRSVNDVFPNDVCTIIYTSGTTGKPKGAIFSHSAVLNGALSYAENFGYTSKDKILVTAPFYHILGGNYTAILCLLA